jgi:hypothetical protein
MANTDIICYIEMRQMLQEVSVEFGYVPEDDAGDMTIQPPPFDVTQMSGAQTMALHAKGIMPAHTLGSYPYKTPMIQEMFNIGSEQNNAFNVYNEGVLDLNKFDASKSKPVQHMTGKKCPYN